MNNITKRFSYVPKDVHTLQPEDFIPNEILLDYENTDLIIVDKLGEAFSFKKFITLALEDKLSVDHLTQCNQHGVVDIDKMLPGFMKPDDAILLSNLDDMINEYTCLLENNRINSKFNVIRLDYNISGKDISLESVINNVGSLINVSGCLNLGDRPEKNYINIIGDMGYRNDLLAIQVSPDRCELRYIMDVSYEDDNIIMADNTLKYDTSRCVYIIDGLNNLVPLLLIKRRNNEFVSEYNIFGKYSDNYISKEEITDISRRVLPNISYGRIIESMIPIIENNTSYGGDKTKIVRSNLKYETDVESTLSYISFNGNDIDIVSGSKLNKSCTFKSSPFGIMMLNSKREGDTISLKHNNSDFKIDMILDIANHMSIVKQHIFSIHDALLNNHMIELDYLGKGLFKIVYKGITFDTFDIYSLDEISNRYISIVIHVSRSGITVLLNGNDVAHISIDVDVYNMANFMVNSLSFPIGNVLVSDDTVNICNPYINNNVILMEAFDIASKENVLDYKNISFTSKDMIVENVGISIYTEGIISNQIKEGSLIELTFDKELVYNINPISTISNIDGNMITLNNDNFRSIQDIGEFKIGDNVIVSKDRKGVVTRDIFTILFIEDNNIILDRDMDIEHVGYYISNMSNTNYVKLTDNMSNNVGSVGIRDNVVKIISRKAYSSTSIFKLEYIEKKNCSNIIDCIKDVENISFGGVKIEATDNSMIKKATLVDMNLTVNGNSITKSPNNIAIFDENNISVSMSYDISKCIRDINSIILNNAIDVTCRVRIANGENELYVNDTQITVNPCMRYIDIPLVLVDNIVKIDILSESLNNNNKLIIDDLSIIIKFKDKFKKVFIRRENSGKIIDYLLMSNIGLYSNISPLNMAISQKVDSFEIDKNVLYISEDINGYRLVSDENMLVKILQVASGKIYKLEKYYII